MSPQKKSNLNFSYAEIQSYQTVQHQFTQEGYKDRDVHLLLGNGFSIAYDKNVFSYNALNKYIEKLDNKVLNELFNIIKTKNFETIMEQLEQFYDIAIIFKVDAEIAKQIKDTGNLLKESLINAVKQFHPETVYSITEEKSLACASFLNYFIKKNGNIFSTNYDLLLYWVQMRNEIENSGDGFGKEVEEAQAYDDVDLSWGKYKDSQNINYLHGALHLFDNGIDVTKEFYTYGHPILENINTRMNKKEYPIFVAAGSGDDKLKHIMHNKYLSFCYDKFSAIKGSLIVFGFRFGSFDEHIIKAINKANKGWYDEDENFHKLFSIYVGVFSEEDFNHIKSIELKFKCKVNVFDAKTLNIWGANK